MKVWKVVYRVGLNHKVFLVGARDDDTATTIWRAHVSEGSWVLTLHVCTLDAVEQL